MREIVDLTEIRAAFDTVLIDQFGVLHDGHQAFPNTRACVTRLADEGVPMVALSNSGKRSQANRDRLTRLGFPAELFHDVVTSGELAHREISARLNDGRLPDLARVAVISRDEDVGMIAGLSVRHVGLDQNPDLLVIAGAEPETHVLTDYTDAIAPLASARVPALCINPDRHIYANGNRGFGPGQIAEAYAVAGGPVEMLGKPGREMFLAGLKALGNPQPERCLMIGDSPEHDIAGAKAVGCLSLLITSGVQSETGAETPDIADFAMPGLVYENSGR